MKILSNAAILLLILLPACNAEMEILDRSLITHCEDAANRSWEYWNGRLAEKPYDPQTFAWELSYAMRAFVKLYAVTGTDLWLERALSWADHCLNYSDVNGDGRPAWGNYNEIWGREGYPFVESVVIDGMVAQPMIELAQMIYGYADLSSNQTLVARADAYTRLVRDIIEWRKEYWIDVTPDSGYYWNDPTNPEMKVINRFASLGIVEMTLADVLGMPGYLDRPERMAKYIKDNLAYDEACDCYSWSYHIGRQGAEDITHGSIDVEFMVRAYQHGLVFNEADMQRLVNTYQRRVWTGIEMYSGKTPFAIDVKGRCCLDYYQYAKNWPLLCLIDPAVIEQHRVALETIARDRPGLHRDRVVAWTLAQMIELEGILISEGIDVTELRAFTPEMIEPELSILSQLIEDVGEVGVNASKYEPLMDELVRALNDLPRDITGLLGKIWNATEMVKSEKAGAYIALAEDVISRAKAAGIDTSRHELFVLGAREAYNKGNYESAWTLCEYPLKLEEELVELPLAAGLALTIMVTLYFRSHSVPGS